MRPLDGNRALSSQEVTTTKHGSQVQTCYIAVDGVEWDYAPLGINQMTAMPFDHMSQLWTEHANNRIGKLYRKAGYREYTDSSFTTLKRAPATNIIAVRCAPRLECKCRARKRMIKLQIRK